MKNSPLTWRTPEAKILKTDLPTLISVICDLMTSYAVTPCAMLAKNVNQYLVFLLNYSSASELAEWEVALTHLQGQWETIALQHDRHIDTLHSMAQPSSLIE